MAKQNLYYTSGAGKMGKTVVENVNRQSFRASKGSVISYAPIDSTTNITTVTENQAAGSSNGGVGGVATSGEVAIASPTIPPKYIWLAVGLLVVWFLFMRKGAKS